MKRIALTLTDEEYEEVKKIAGLASLSRVMKDAAFRHIHVGKPWMPTVESPELEPRPEKRAERVYGDEGDGVPF